MDQIIYVRIFSIIAYLFILVGVIIMIIRDLIKGEVRQWMRGTPLFDTSKYKVEKNTLIFNKKEFPKEYWTQIVFRVFILIVVLILGFVVYNKLF